DAQIAALHALIRKGAHVTEYAVLAALWFVALTRERGLSRRRAAWLAFVVAVGWAFLDELHQATEPSRTASAMDVAIDATGALAAATVGRHGGGRVLDGAAPVAPGAAAGGGAAGGRGGGGGGGGGGGAPGRGGGGGGGGAGGPRASAGAGGGWGGGARRGFAGARGAWGSGRATASRGRDERRGVGGHVG